MLILKTGTAEIGKVLEAVRRIDATKEIKKSEYLTIFMAFTH